MDRTDLKFNIRFLRCVKKYPIIYNTKIKKYKKRNDMDIAWQAIAEELNMEPLTLKKKWKNFRSVMSRNLRQERMGQNVPPYYLREHIKFLIPFMRAADGSEASYEQTKNEESEDEYDLDNLDDVDDMDNQYESDLEQDVNESEDEDSIYFDYNKDGIAASNLSKSLLDPEEKADVPKPTYDQKISSSSVQNESITSTPPSCVASTSTGNADREQLAAIEKAKKQFLDSLLPDLNLMSHSQMRQFKYKVLQLIDNILIRN